MRGQTLTLNPEALPAKLPKLRKFPTSRIVLQGEHDERLASARHTERTIGSSGLSRISRQASWIRNTDRFVSTIFELCRQAALIERPALKCRDRSKGVESLHRLVHCGEK